MGSTTWGWEGTEISIALGLVLASGFTHAVWNLFTKSSINKSAFLWAIHIGSFVLLLPFFIVELSEAHIPLRGYAFMGLSMLFQCGYFLLLPLAYSKGDMSQVYPLMRGIGALLVPVAGVTIFGESLTQAGWLGIGCIVFGLFAIGGGSLSVTRLRHLWPAASVGLCITGYVSTDKVVLEYISPLALIELCNIAYIGLMTPLALRKGRLRTEWKANRWRIIAGTFLSPGSYLLFLLAVKLAPLSHLAPIREMGTVFGTILGIFILKEQQGSRRIAMSVVITAGVVSVGLWGGS
ncbi:SMR family transporter [Paenibacillus oceani]|uniref:EamA family transporter n=1 Tax=Paenibacillus oceani TaxID=2772510 RepID=A0A927C6F9_9BACL|nr:SMR family transporter [Paenibacillus oceani]MBD2861729.1 EamA family transporter [Paenibacillus oceani]